MKKIYVLLVLCLGATVAFSQTLFTYGPYSVSKDEFLKAYNKNKTNTSDPEKALREYLDLYSRFKLKVKVAETQRLDTIKQLQYDLQNFRSQVQEGYMNDEKGVNALIDEAILRGQKDIHVLHFYGAVNTKMSAADSNSLYRAMTEVAEQLKKSQGRKNDLEKITAKYPGIQGADLGHITVFTLPYDIENLVYSLHPGEVSKIYRTKSAIHIFKTIDERKSVGKWKVAQVLLSVPPEATAEELKTIEKRADSIYKLAVAGEDFGELAKRFSEDKLSFINGGELPEFTTGKYDPAFEAKIFEMKKDGDISKPIFTGDGYHIVKRLQQKDAPVDKSDELITAAIRQQVQHDSRIEAAKAIFLQEVKAKTGFKRNAAVKDADLFRYADSVASNGAIGYFPINNKIMFSFIKLNVKGVDWLNFVKDYKLNRDVYKGENNKQLLDKYITTTSFEYYRKHLEEYSPEFKFQMQEFKEGNMLFEIMEKTVWSKASNDSVGQKKYYDAHEAKYKWEESADILLFNCSEEKTATAAIEMLEAGKDWKKMVEESDGKIQADSGRYELAQIQTGYDKKVYEGLITKPLTNSGDYTTSFIKVLRLFPANQQRSFGDARGLVINDYQGALEEKWINELKTKYPIKINETVFQTLLK